MSDLPVPHIDLTPLFAAQDLTPEQRGNWWLVDGLYPAIRVHADGHILTIDLALTENVRVSETYPVKNGLSLFRDGALPHTGRGARGRCMRNGVCCRIAAPLW